ncbi:MAG: GGDEF domain-containing protein [Gemmatimonadota bacterium]
MFFFKKEHDPHLGTASAGAARVDPSAQPGDLRAASPADDVTQLLDALGGVLAALAHHPVDLPHRPAEVTARELTAWQRHATLGMSVDGVDDAAVGIPHRDWGGLVRTVTELRRDEQHSVDALVSELRTALWSCVSAVHEAVRIDDSADSRTGAHLALVKRAVVSASQMSTIREEVLAAVSEIDRTLRERRDEQQRQYRTLASSLDSLGRQLEEAKRESATDPLTGVGNRKHFDLMALRAAQLFSLGRAPVTLLMIDLDKLKIINDSYGHVAGDCAITTVAQALKLVFLRQSDVVCRYGGDEFAVILNNCDLLVAQTLAKRLLDQVKALPAPTQAMEFALGASVGVAQLQPAEDLAQWIARADRAMYQAKRSAMGGVMLADSDAGPAGAVQRRSA